MRQEYLETIYPALNRLRRYHNHTVVGIENVPKEGAAIIAVNHSLATYDITLLSCAIYEEVNRITRALADRLFFKLPYVGNLVEDLGAVEGNKNNAHKLINCGELLTVAPGGMKEALRPSSQRYQINWKARKGFAKLAIETRAPVIIAVCPKADDLFEVYPSVFTRWAYQNLKIPLFFARGRGITLLPRPIKLTHFLSKPIYPPKPSQEPKIFQRQLTVFHKKLVKQAEVLIGQAISQSD